MLTLPRLSSPVTSAPAPPLPLWPACVPGTPQPHDYNSLASFSHLCPSSVFSLGLPSGASGKEPTCQCRIDVRDSGSIPGSGRAPGGGHGNPLQYSCLEDPMDRGAWGLQSTASQSQTQLKPFRTHTHSVLSTRSLKKVILFKTHIRLQPWGFPWRFKG